MNFQIVKYYQMIIIMSFYVSYSIGCFSTAPATNTPVPQAAPTQAPTQAPTTTTAKVTTTVYNFAQLTQQLNASLSNFLNIRFVPVLQSKAASSSRPTSEQGRLLNDIVNFVLSFSSNVSTSNASAVVQSLTVDPTVCPFTSSNITCDSTFIYHSLDGKCNNLKNPLYGSANIPYTRYTVKIYINFKINNFYVLRILKPAYGDGYNTPRILQASGKVITY
jgi:hypothetical protein